MEAEARRERLPETTDSNSDSSDPHLAGVLDEQLGSGLSHQERETLVDVLGAIRAIRFGSVSITLHEGRVVEVVRTQRIRGRDSTSGSKP